MSEDEVDIEKEKQRLSKIYDSLFMNQKKKNVIEEPINKKNWELLKGKKKGNGQKLNDRKEESEKNKNGKSINGNLFKFDNFAKKKNEKFEEKKKNKLKNNSNDIEKDKNWQYNEQQMIPSIASKNYQPN